MSDSNSKEPIKATVGRVVAPSAIGAIVGGLTGNHHIGHAASSAASELLKRHPQAAETIGEVATEVGKAVTIGVVGAVASMAFTFALPVLIPAAIIHDKFFSKPEP